MDGVLKWFTDYIVGPTVTIWTTHTMPLEVISAIFVIIAFGMYSVLTFHLSKYNFYFRELVARYDESNTSPRKTRMEWEARKKLELYIKKDIDSKYFLHSLKNMDVSELRYDVPVLITAARSCYIASLTCMIIFGSAVWPKLTVAVLIVYGIKILFTTYPALIDRTDEHIAIYDTPEEK